LQEEWPWLGVANTWFLKRATDEWEQQGQPQAYFRLLTPDFQPLPVYQSMQAYTADLEPTLYQGYHQEDHWALRYDGQWQTLDDPQAVLGQLRQTADPAAELAFTFQGSDLTLVAPKAPAMGRWTVELDGRPLSDVSLQASTFQPAQRLVVATGLSNQRSHQLVLRPAVDEQGQVLGPVAVDGWVVRSRNMGLVNALYCVVTLGFLLFAGFVGYLWLVSRRSIPQDAGWP
jgi:hypothetical protein